MTTRDPDNAAFRLSEGPTRDAARQLARNRLSVVAVAAVVLWLVVVALPGGQDDGAAIRRLNGDDCAFDTAHDRGRAHVAAPTYSVDPPAGGAHSPDPAPAANYRGRDTPPDGEIVHAMEHGIVVVWHGSLSPEDRTTLDALWSEHPDELIVAERRSLGARVAVTSWGRRLLCARFDPQRAKLFVCTFRHRAPERLLTARSRC